MTDGNGASSNPLALFGDRRAPTDDRVEAAYAFAQRSVKGSESVVLRVFLDDEEEREVREAAAYALGFFGRSQRSRGPLLRAAESHPDEWVREAAVSALAHGFNRRYVVPVMLRILENRRESPAVRGEAAHTLGMSLGVGGSSAVVRRLLPHLRDPSPKVRLLTAYALAICEKKRALPALQRLVDDHTEVPRWWTVAREARWAITQIQKRRYEDPGMPNDEICGTDRWQDRIKAWKRRRRRWRKKSRA